MTTMAIRLRRTMMSEFDYLQEVTVWDDTSYTVSNHTYILNKAGQLAGYIKSGTSAEIWFKSPRTQFSKSRRKFERVNKPK